MAYFCLRTRSLAANDQNCQVLLGACASRCARTSPHRHERPRRLRAGRSLNTAPCALEIRSLIPERADLELAHRMRKTAPCLCVPLPQPSNKFEWFAISHQRKRDKAPTGVAFQAPDRSDSPRVAESRERTMCNQGKCRTCEHKCDCTLRHFEASCFPQLR